MTSDDVALFSLRVVLVDDHGADEAVEAATLRFLSGLAA